MRRQVENGAGGSEPYPCSRAEKGLTRKTQQTAWQSVARQNPTALQLDFPAVRWEQIGL